MKIKDQIKKYLCALFVCSVVFSLFALSALAAEPSGEWEKDWITEEKNLKNEDHYANYNPSQFFYNYGSWFHDAWCSAEVSVPSNGYGYAFAEITDSDGNVRVSDIDTNNPNANIDGGWLKLPAVYGEVNGAKQVRFAGQQKVGGNTEEVRLKWVNNKW